MAKDLIYLHHVTSGAMLPIAGLSDTDGSMYFLGSDPDAAEAVIDKMDKAIIEKREAQSWRHFLEFTLAYEGNPSWWANSPVPVDKSSDLTALANAEKAAREAERKLTAIKHLVLSGMTESAPLLAGKIMRVLQAKDGDPLY